jgi:exonuclease-1
MGITGLIPLLDQIQKPVHVSQFAGQRVAVDGHCWLHRGVFGCAYDLAMDIPTDK